MYRFRSILWQKLDLVVGPLKVLDLALHRHLPETTLGMHRHRVSQFLLYLAGHGFQYAGDLSRRVGAGSLVALPGGVSHAFERYGTRPALCMVVDFSMPRKPGQGPVITDLGALALGSIRETLARIARSGGAEGQAGDIPSRVRRSAMTLQLLQPLLEGTGWFPGATARLRSPIVGRTEKVLGEHACSGLGIGEIARRIGYQPDYLNRILKIETGLTLGQWRARERMARACKLLAGEMMVGDVAAEIGMSDQNYFARWFREQTGTAPSRWRKTGGRVG